MSNGADHNNFYHYATIQSADYQFSRSMPRPFTDIGEPVSDKLQATEQSKEGGIAIIDGDTDVAGYDYHNDVAVVYNCLLCLSYVPTKGLPHNQKAKASLTDKCLNVIQFVVNDIHGQYYPKEDKTEE